MSEDIIREYKKQLLQCRNDIHNIVQQYNCNPIIVRLAWHDSGTYDKSIPLSQWPACGGANGSIIYEQELAHGANAGLEKAVRYLKPLKKKYSLLSFADIIQMASAEAILLAGGPRIDMKYGRIDAKAPAIEGNLPAAGKPFPNNEKTAAEHLKKVFYRMGFNNQEIVCLSGAHTLGRAFKERSGVVDNGYGKSNATKYTNGDFKARKDNTEGVGMVGGKSWTKKWLSFDNSYFKQYRENDSSLLWLETDQAVAEEADFKKWFERYAKDEELFFSDYAKVHKKLSELGSRYFVEGGLSLDTANL